jgi:hypothetical protein
MRTLTQHETYPVMQVKVTGESEHGKSTLVAQLLLELAAISKKTKYFVWPADGRAQDYTKLLGRENVLVPDANALDSKAVLEEVIAYAKTKEFKAVAGASVDTVTLLWDKAIRTDKGGATALSKAQVMGNVRAAIGEFIGANIPFFALTHIYPAATSATISNNTYRQEDRETLSVTEAGKLNRLTWLHLRCVRKGDPKDPESLRYGVIVTHSRYKTTNKVPFTLWDAEENRVNETPFVGMYDRLMQALFGSEAVEVVELEWVDYGAERPFPTPERAIQMGAYHFIESEEAPGMKFYAWGDPEAERIRKDGLPGSTGAFHRASAVYNLISPRGRVAKGTKPEMINKYRAKYPNISNAEEMAVAWKQEVEERCHVALAEFLAKAKAQADADVDAEIEAGEIEAGVAPREASAPPKLETFEPEPEEFGDTSTPVEF